MRTIGRMMAVTAVVLASGAAQAALFALSSTRTLVELVSWLRLRGVGRSSPANPGD